jgi:hypothetical protein
MVLLAFITFVLTVLAYFGYNTFPRPLHDPFADQPDIFRVWQFEPKSDFGCSGCLVVLSLFIASIGFLLQNQTAVMAGISLSIFCMVLVLIQAVKEVPHRRIERNSLARIELTKDSIFIYNLEGMLANEATFADIVDLPMFQGVDSNRRHYVDRLLVLKSGEEILLPRYGKNGRDLKERIHQATNMKFRFRNNSTRHS